MAKNKAGLKREENLSDRIKEMENLINGFQPEYDEKKALLDEISNKIKEAEAKYEALINEYKDEAYHKVADEYQEKMNEANNILEEAKNKEDAAEALKKEAHDKYNEALEKIKIEKKALDEEKKAKEKEIKEYDARIRADVDDYSKTKKLELKERESNIKSKEDALKLHENQLIEKEHQLASMENELAKQKADAQFGFQTLLKEERKKYDVELSKVKDNISNLEKKLISGQEKIDDDLALYKTQELSKINETLKLEREKLDELNRKLQGEMRKIHEKNLELESEKSVVQTQKSHYEKKNNDFDNLVNKSVKEKYQNLLDEIEIYKKQCNELQFQITEKQKKIVELTSRLKNNDGLEIEKLKNEIDKLNEKIQFYSDNENSIIGKLKKYNVDSATLVTQLHKIEEYDNLIKNYEKLNKDYEQKYLELLEARNNEDALIMASKKANMYEENYNNALAELDRLKKPSRKDRLSGFTSFIDFDDIVKLDAIGPNTSEIIWLNNIKKKMEESEIKISSKLLYAFHTSIKIHDWSPLVVLAGVSGTGKSELPRQYAQHGGMNFISIPVKPDWDSMQSLFGYYNSIENKFEPTELSRAIYYMKNPQMNNTMLLVLLDEMNLAYVELYFSDLLSKFETNRGTEDTIIYELSLGANEPVEKMEIGKNILWVGTMNEDETTKALSDKVVDRSTLLTFPRPKTLVSRRSDVRISKTEKRLTYSLWSKWCSNTLSEEKIKDKIDINMYRKIIEDINEQMSKVNRNLGHRVWQSIERYVFSHPMTISNLSNGSEFKKQFDSAFAEAVAFKVMPKLRGIEVSGESRKVLDSIGTIINQEIPSLIEDYKQAMSLSSRIFQWCSAKFMDVDEKGE